MRLTIFGATGRTGSELTRQALAAGHEVTAVVRRPDQLATADGLTVVAADVFDPTAVEGAVVDRDAVLSALGPRGRRERVCAPAARAIVGAMRAVGTRRIVAVSAVPVGPPDEASTWVDRRLARPLLWRVFGELYRDLGAMEDELAASGLDWTVVRPPRLTDGPRTGRYRRAVGGNVRGGYTVARADVADAMLACLVDDETSRMALAVAN